MNSVPAADSVEPVAPPLPRPPPARRTALLLEQTQPAGSREQTAVTREGGGEGGREGGRGGGELPLIVSVCHFSRYSSEVLCL